MAAICTRFCTRSGFGPKSNLSLQLLTEYSRRSLSSKTTYYRKHKHRQNTKISELDVQDILYGKTSGTAGTIDMTDASAGKLTKTAQDNNNGSWYHSKERLQSLKKTEKM